MTELGRRAARRPTAAAQAIAAVAERCARSRRAHPRDGAPRGARTAQVRIGSRRALGCAVRRGRAASTARARRRVASAVRVGRSSTRVHRTCAATNVEPHVVEHTVAEARASTASTRGLGLARVELLEVRAEATVAHERARLVRAASGAGSSQVSDVGEAGGVEASRGVLRAWRSSTARGRQCGR